MSLPLATELGVYLCCGFQAFGGQCVYVVLDVC